MIVGIESQAQGEVIWRNNQSTTDKHQHKNKTAEQEKKTLLYTPNANKFLRAGGAFIRRSLLIAQIEFSIPILDYRSFSIQAIYSVMGRFYVFVQD